MTETAEHASDAADEAAAAAEAAATAAAEAAAAEAAEEEEENNDEEEQETPAPPAPHGESAHDDEVALDHEQRLTRTEDALAALAAAVEARPTYDEVRSMTPDPSTVAEVAATVGAGAAEEAIHEHEDEEHGDHDEGDGAEGVRVEEKDGGVEITPVMPETPPANDDEPRRRGFRW